MEVNTQKNIIIKLNFWLMIFLLGIFLSCMAVKAANGDIYDYVTEIHIGNANATWQWGNDAIDVEVGSGEPVYVQYTLHFKEDEWEPIYQSGSIRFNCSMPEGASVTPSGNHIVATVGNEEKSIGTIEIAGSQIIISIYDEYKTFVEQSTDREFSLGLVLEFIDGDYNLGDKVNITASNTGSSMVRWTSKSIIVNKIDAEDDTKLLGNAYFEIDEYEYSQDENKYINKALYSLTPDKIEANESFTLKENGFITIQDTSAVLTGGFAPGKLYHLREVTPPIGYLPWREPIKFGFYHYTEDETSGTVHKLQYNNEIYTKQYSDEGRVAVFGNEQAYGELKAPNIYVKNQKVPDLQILKVDALLNKPMEGVEFTLQISAKQTGYSASAYLDLENGGWTYDSTTDLLKWTMKTDKDGMISYPEGTVPYCASMYELVETVPEGYEGYGSSKITRFQVTTKEDGSVEVVSDTGEVDTVNGINTIKILNQPVADVRILKVDESGSPLKGAEFAIYGTSERNTEDVIEKAGKKYYKLQEATTQKDGTATFAGLPYGDYYLVEKKAPQGYKILKDSHRIEVSKDILEDGVYTVKITNKKQGTPVIDTGGKGIFRNIAIGVLMLLLGGFFFLVARKKRRRKKAKRRAQAARRRANGQAPQRRRNPQKRSRK